MSEAADSQAVFDLMRARLVELFGPGGSFRITLGRATQDDAVFVETVADTIAWDVAASLESRAVLESGAASAAHAAPSTMEQHEALWREIEEQLLIRRTGDDALEVSLPATHSRRAAA